VFSRLARDYPGEEGWHHAMIRSARTARDAGDLAAEIRQIESLLAESSAAPLLRYRLALLYLEKGDYGKAAAEFGHAAESGGGLARFARFEEASSTVAAGRRLSGEGLFLETARTWDGTEMGAWATFIAGSFLFERGRYDKAAETLGRFPAGTGGELEASALFLRGRSLQLEKREEDAMEDFLSSRMISPRGSYAQRASYRAAEIARGAGRATLAAELFREAIALGRDDVITELSQEGLRSLLSEADEADVQ
jgi:tetratricopeptide (TPR) repeat protein